jgi:hypothetical protein
MLLTSRPECNEIDPRVGHPYGRAEASSPPELHLMQPDAYAARDPDSAVHHDHLLGE